MTTEDSSNRLGALSGASPASWAMGSLFAIGSICFAVGSLPLFFDAVSPSVVATTFFVGSIFFTSAAYLQFRGAPPRSTDWWAATVQLVGTVFFNVSTFAATRSDLSTEEDRHLVWAPDVYGSICFLVASWLAYAALNRGIRPRSDHSVGWRIAAVNLLGSIAFGASAIAARIEPSTGEMADIPVANLGTFAGAVCFLLGAALLPVQSARAAGEG